MLVQGDQALDAPGVPYLISDPQSCPAGKGVVTYTVPEQGSLLANGYSCPF